jgi:hypothetical protein
MAWLWYVFFAVLAVINISVIVVAWKQSKYDSY